MLKESTPRRRMPLVAGAGVLLVVAAAVVGVAAAQDPPPPAPELLTGRAVFPDDVDLKFKLKEHGGATTVVKVEDPSRTAVVRFTLQAGSTFPWHTHLGPVVVNVVSGALTYIDGDSCAETTYAAGEAFVDPGQGHVHTAYNPGPGATVLMATFFDAPATGSLLIPADNPGC